MDTTVEPTLLHAREQLSTFLVAKNVLTTNNGQSGFWDNDTWVSFYDLWEELLNA